MIKELLLLLLLLLLEGDDDLGDSAARALTRN